MGCIHADGGSPNYVCNRCAEEEVRAQMNRGHDSMHCALCLYKGPDLKAHMAEKHPLAKALKDIAELDLRKPFTVHGTETNRVEKKIDPGNEPSRVPHSLYWLIALMRKQNGIDLKAAEGMMLLGEIDRLNKPMIHEGCGGELVVAEWQCTNCGRFEGNP